MKHEYVPHVFRAKPIDKLSRLGPRGTVDILVKMTDEFHARGHVSNLRAIHYQMVAHHGWPNKKNYYERLQRYISNARRSGEIHWDTIEDQVRTVEVDTRFDSPADALRSVAAYYHEDFWTGQPKRPFLIIEKAALTTVLKPVCEEFDVPLLAARGNASDSVLWELATKHFLPAIAHGQTPVILYLGDHDPSGLQMSEDAQEKLSLYSGARSIRLDRLALNWDQVGALPASFENQVKEATAKKKGDVRGPAYVKKFGTTQIWELDALSPDYLIQLVRDAVQALIEKPAVWKKRQAAIAAGKARLEEIADDEE